MPRLFVGLSFEKGLTPEFLDMFKKLKITCDKKKLDIKWSSVDNLHLTLKFLGDVDVKDIEEVKEIIKGTVSEASPISLKVKGLGGFPDERQTRVLWAGAQGKIGLRLLAQKIDEDFTNRGYLQRDEEFVPHITLGRLRNRKSVQDVISPFVRKKFGEFTSFSVNLYESHLQGNHPVYKVIESFPFAGK